MTINQLEMMLDLYHVCCGLECFTVSLIRVILEGIINQQQLNSILLMSDLTVTKKNIFTQLVYTSDLATTL